MVIDNQLIQLPHVNQQ